MFKSGELEITMVTGMSFWDGEAPGVSTEILPVKVPVVRLVVSTPTVICAIPAGFVFPVGGLNVIQFLPAGLGSTDEIKPNPSCDAGETAMVSTCEVMLVVLPICRLKRRGSGETVTTGAAV